MKPIKAEIIIKNGIIESITELKDSSIIIENGRKTTFSGSYVLPGLLDYHCHLWGLGMTMLGMPINNAKTPQEIIEIIKDKTHFRGGWIFGRGWNQELWDTKAYPDKQILDEAFPDTPVVLTRIDGHADWVNSKALDIAGIDRHTPDPPGGEIIKNENGEPTGLLIDDAMQLVEKHLPYYSLEQLEEMILTGANECIKKGLTGLHDMDVSPVQIPIFQKLDNTDELPLRVYSYVSAQNDQWMRDKVKPYKGNLFKIIGLKLFADGALGSHGAALLEPYNDNPKKKGLILLEKDKFIDSMRKGINMGFQIATHAIGDAAVRFVLDCYEIIRKEYPDAVLRIEHSQMIHPDDLLRFKELNIIAVVQPVHCTSDAATMAIPRIGEKRATYSYLWKTLLDNNIKVLGSSDFPIESHDPLTGIDAFINRIPIGRSESWNQQETITHSEALKAYSTAGTDINGMDNSLNTGSQADITIISNKNFDLNTKDHSKIKAVYINGKLKYKS